jgi:translation initiation factor IF-2
MWVGAVITCVMLKPGTSQGTKYSPFEMYFGKLLTYIIMSILQACVTIAGSYVQDGKITRQSQIRVLRDGIVIFEDKISSLRRFKDDVKEVASGYECGIGLEKFNDIKEGDILEAFEMQEVSR